MSTPKLYFEGSSKIVLEGSSDVITSVVSNVPGLSMSKCKTKARFKRDEITYLFVKKVAKPQIDPKVTEWAYEEAAKNKLLATKKMMEDTTLTIPYNDKLRAYQRVDVMAMQSMKRLILGNAPGTGKTIEAIAYCDEVRASKVLVIASKSLMHGWHKAIQDWSVNTSSIVVPVDTNYKRAEKTLANLNSEHRYYIINYEMLRDKKFERLWKQKWDVVICDEAHRLKGRDTQQSAGASRLKTDSLILATGTWITNNHHEVYQLLHLLDPTRFSSYWQFVDRFCQLEDDWFSKQKKVTGPKNMNAYKYMMHKYLIQRRKEDVLKELPEVIHKTIPIEMTPYQSKLYQNIKEDMMSDLENGNMLVTPTVIASYIKLRQITLTPALVDGKDDTNKTLAILDIIENTDEQVIVFSWFKKYINHLEKILTKKKIPFGSIHGDIPAKARTKAEQDFRAGKTKVMLGTIKAMSEGLNLQTASVLIFSDKSYVPADNSQAIARVDRMGQKKNPLIYHLNTIGTIEDIIETVLTEKQDLIDEASAIEEVIKKLAK